MRIKKDTILKTYILSNTQHLSNEEFGILIRNVMLEDDKDKYRYENLSGLLLDIFKKNEKQWKEDLEKVFLTNPTIISAYSLVFGQANNSRKAFDNMQDRYNEKDKQAKKKKEEDTEFIEQQNNEFKELTFNTNYFINKKTYTATYKAEYENNVPNEEEIADLSFNTDNDTLIKLIEIGNEEEWKRHYEEILNELQAEQQIETETPFDCLESEETENENER